MNINNLPTEILNQILKEAADANTKEGVAWTYGLSQATDQLQKHRFSRHVRGVVSADARKWDSVSSIRAVCRSWHSWALQHALRDIYLRRWRGSERWAELTLQRNKYSFYELIDDLSGCAVYRDPYLELRQTGDLFLRYPSVAARVHRLWFSGYFTREAEALIAKVLRSCRHLEAISVPWTMLRHGSAEDWRNLLGIAHDGDLPLQSLELQAQCLPDHIMNVSNIAVDRHSILDAKVDFGHLKRLKLFGNTTFMPVDDHDLATISKTAHDLEEFHVTCMSTVTIRGVMDIVKGAQQTLRVLEHSPRSNDGFFHPDPGSVDADEHICDTLINCPKLKDLSISMPSMCSHLFSSEQVRWDGECQVRALRLCDAGPTSKSRLESLRRVLDGARKLIEVQRRQRRELDIELFFADCIFDPRDCVVHGNFSLAQISSNGQWPYASASSSKGPYGSTGLYGKDEGDWEIVSEDEYLRAVEAGWITI